MYDLDNEDFLKFLKKIKPFFLIFFKKTINKIGLLSFTLRITFCTHTFINKISIFAKCNAIPWQTTTNVILRAIKPFCRQSLDVLVQPVAHGQMSFGPMLRLHHPLCHAGTMLVSSSTMVDVVALVTSIRNNQWCQRLARLWIHASPIHNN